MSGGYRRGPTGLFGFEPLPRYLLLSFLVYLLNSKFTAFNARMIAGDRRRPLAGLRRARSVPPCATERLTNAEREKRTSFSRSPPAPWKVP